MPPSSHIDPYQKPNGRLQAPKSNRFRERAGLIRNVAPMVSGDDEKRMNEAGVLTISQRTEQSLWGVLASHCFREY